MLTTIFEDIVTKFTEATITQIGASNVRITAIEAICPLLNRRKEDRGL